MQKFLLVNILMLSILLSGCLPAIFTGASASALEFAKDRPAGEAVTDLRISAAIKTAFMKNNFKELYTKIKVEVIQGRVLYTGVIDKNEDAINAVQIAWDQEGVNEVINELTIDKNSGNFNLVQFTRDSLITSQIKSKTFFDRSIKFVNYTIVTLNDVVYIFGIARSEEELQKVGNIASNVHGVKKVVSHVKVNEQAVKIKPSKSNSGIFSNKKEKEPAGIIDEEDGDNIMPAGNNW